MSLLLLFHPSAQGAPPVSPDEEPARVPVDMGGAIGRSRYAHRRREDAIEEDDLTAILAAFARAKTRH